MPRPDAVDPGTAREPYSEERTRRVVEDVHRDGFAFLGPILTSAEVDALRAGIDRVFEDPRFDSNRYCEHLVVRLFETGRIFEEMLTREPILSLVEAVLGEDCHLIAENALRNGRRHRLGDFHVDDLLIFPVGEGMERHDPRLQMPVHVLTAQVVLSDVETREHGPTQYVPGSHASGRRPNHPTDPTFEGRGPVTLLCPAGSVYLHNGQCWHRGMPNLSDRTRYLFQLSYARRWVSQRFYPFIEYRMPEDVLARADARRRRVLGVHPPGDYG